MDAQSFENLDFKRRCKILDIIPFKNIQYYAKVLRLFIWVVIVYIFAQENMHNLKLEHMLI